jgi:membrane-bound lytic murein transglycosylase D
MFGDWNLVLSAYNAWQVSVLKAIRNAGSKNYWKVRQYLPDETKAYVPSFHAVRYIGKMYPLFFDKLSALKYDYSQIKEFKTNKLTTFKEFAKEKELNLQQLYFLNPHIVTEVIPKGAFVYYLR